MQVDESLGTIEAVFDTASPTSKPLVIAAHEFLLKLDPAVFIVPRLGEKSIAYGVGPKKMSEAYCYLIPFNSHVNFGFFHGVDIDTDGLLEGAGAKLRHFKVKSLTDLENPALRCLVLKAIEDRRRSN